MCSWLQWSDLRSSYEYLYHSFACILHLKFLLFSYLYTTLYSWSVLSTQYLRVRYHLFFFKSSTHPSIFTLFFVIDANRDGQVQRVILVSTTLPVTQHNNVKSDCVGLYWLFPLCSPFLWEKSCHLRIEIVF